MTPNALVEALARRPSGPAGPLLVYLMVDAWHAADVRELARACRRAGAAGLELGFPFSDPIADGPVLQAAATRALHHGTRWRDLLSAIRVTSPVLPTVVMTYANPVFRRGLSTACREIAGSGGSGLVVPDLSLEESGPWVRAARAAGLCLVQMASPATSASRVRALSRASSGFLYLVSRFGTTGTGAAATISSLRDRVGWAHAECPTLPVLVGFGVRSARGLGPIRATGADGAIVGSAVEEHLARSRDPERLQRFLAPLVRALAPAAVGTGRVRLGPHALQRNEPDRFGRGRSHPG